MPTNKDYKNAKNYIHNELGINKRYIEQFTENYFEKAIDKIISNKLESKWVENLIIKKIGEIITGEKSNSMWSNKGVDYIKTVIKETVKGEIVKRIKFDSIDVK